MEKYRNEWKYCCNEAQTVELRQRMSAILEFDPNADEDGTYEIHSLYFDDYGNSCVNDTDAGSSRRFKYRIRFYGDNTKTLHLERKEKLYDRCHKESCSLTYDEYEKILKCEEATLYWETDNKLLKQFCLEIMTRMFRPVAIIDYKRTAFVEPISNVRITVDENISVSNDIGHFLDGNYLRMPIQEINNQILEVKFDYILPGYIKMIVCDGNMTQTSFSKYTIGRQKLYGFGRYR